MKILVTGAAGFVGSNLSDYLLARDHTVVGVDNFNEYYSPKIKEYNIRDFREHSNFKLYRNDLLDTDLLDTLFSTEKIDAVVHLAAWAGVTSSIDDPVTYVRNNEEVTVKLLEACKKHGVKNFLFASTSSIYGDNPTPFTEDMTSDFPLAPYPATKKASEVMIYTYAKNFGINATIFRIFNPNGQRMRPDLALPKLIKSCLYGYEFPMYWTPEDADKSGRDYCYVNHIFDAMVSVLQKPLPYEIFNLGNSTPVTLTQLISTVEKVTGKKVNVKQMPSRKGEMMVTYANIDKAKAMLGYDPSTSIEQIVQIYYEWFLKQEDWYQRVTSAA
jgi:UDP-glucuronate 4-epimerase